MSIDERSCLNTNSLVVNADDRNTYFDTRFCLVFVILNTM